jgi:type I restriction enzyme, R subunit
MSSTLRKRDATAASQYSAGDRDQVHLDPDEAVRQTLTRLESAEALLGEAPWREFFGGAPAGRLTVLKRCLEALLAAGRRDDFLKTATELETAYALAAGEVAGVGTTSSIARAARFVVAISPTRARG